MKNTKPIKIKWKGQFNYKHSLHILYCYASTERGAWKNMCFQLAKKHGVEVGWVMGLFDGKSDNFQITIEKPR